MSGLILPDIFIPLAEELGLLDVVSGQLFGDACREAVTWPDDISLSFNFSPSQLSDRRFADAVLTVLNDTGLPAHRLEAEITESALVEDLEATRHAIQTLRNAGVRIVIDDFGTGYSSLYHLYELRFDKLKIDRRFIQELVASGESEIFIRAIVGLCKGLNLLSRPRASKPRRKRRRRFRTASIKRRDSCSAEPSRLPKCHCCSAGLPSSQRERWFGHPRRFERPLRTTALPSFATELLHYGNRRAGPSSDIRRGLRRTTSSTSAQFLSEYYSEARTHLSVSKDAPIPRAIKAHRRTRRQNSRIGGRLLSRLTACCNVA